ncbi:MAG: hypothetical protein M3388_11010 [Acidobacteriota bacterium]|nr:hypothetical protein [Acidobacteriota bacterium]
MCAKWNNNKIDQKTLANKLNQRIKNLSGDFNHHDSVITNILTVIYSSLEFDSKIPETEKRNIVWKGISATVEKGDVTEKFLGEISREENSYKNLKPQKFVLVTSISVNYFGELNKIKLPDKITIIFNRFLPNKFSRKSIIESVRQGKVVREDEIPSNFVYVRANVEARSIVEAYHKAIDALDLLRGVWNLYFNLGVGRRMSFGGKNPVNKIILGPIHTLHKSNGKLATEDFWYEPNYVKPLFPFSITNDYKKLKKYEKLIRGRIRNSNYSTEIENSILKYTRALDERNFNNAFLALWSLLENLTGSIASYDDAIKRTLFLYKDKEFHKLILEHLRSYRNKTIHTGDSISEGMETLLYQLKSYVEMLLRFHLYNNLKFKDISESAQFLSLNSDRNFLKEKINWLSKAEKFLQKYS